MNEYITLDDFRRYQGIDMDQHDQDALLRQLLTNASRTWDAWTQRRFYPRVETRYYDHPREARRLWLDDDLLELTALTTYNGGTTLLPSEYFPMAGSSYQPPYSNIVLHPTKQFAWTGTPQKANAVTGIWGYHNDWDAAWWPYSTLASDVNASQTTITVTSGPGGAWNGIPFQFEPGMLLKLGTEYLHLLAVDAATLTLTVVRGANGTSAAAHDSGLIVAAYEVDPAVQNAVRRLTAWMWHQKDSATFVTTGYPEIGLVEVPSGMPPDIQRLIARFKRKGR
jgi:hypothetical protein